MENHDKFMLYFTFPAAVIALFLLHCKVIDLDKEVAQLKQMVSSTPK